MFVELDSNIQRFLETTELRSSRYIVWHLEANKLGLTDKKLQDLAEYIGYVRLSGLPTPNPWLLLSEH